MFIQAELILQKRNAMMVPLAAVTEREGQKVVFIAQDSIAAMHAISTGSAMRDSIEIVRGLKLSDRVIVSGTHLLNDKDKIKLATR
jgi:membrane fusion protein (multidrug efflux system)